MRPLGNLVSPHVVSPSSTGSFLTPRLVNLNKCRGPAAIPGGMGRVQTPLQVEQWRSALLSHQDTDLVQLVLEGMSCGFRINFDYRTKEVHVLNVGQSGGGGKLLAGGTVGAKWWAH